MIYAIISVEIQLQPFFKIFSCIDFTFGFFFLLDAKPIHRPYIKLH